MSFNVRGVVQMRWTVEGADSGTGAYTQVILDAATDVEAAKKARLIGVSVSSVRRWGPAGAGGGGGAKGAEAEAPDWDVASNLWAPAGAPSAPTAGTPGHAADKGRAVVL